MPKIEPFKGRKVETFIYKGVQVYLGIDNPETFTFQTASLQFVFFCGVCNDDRKFPHVAAIKSHITQKHYRPRSVRRTSHQ